MQVEEGLLEWWAVGIAGLVEELLERGDLGLAEGVGCRALQLGGDASSLPVGHSIPQVKVFVVDDR